MQTQTQLPLLQRTLAQTLITAAHGHALADKLRAFAKTHKPIPSAYRLH